MMCLVFKTLIWILFAYNHLIIKNNSLFIIYAQRSVGAFSKEQVKVTSSAKRVNLKNRELYGKSLMKFKNNNGPDIQPCGTSQSIKRRSEMSSLMDTYCSLLDKYNQNQLKAIPRTPYERRFLRRILWSSQSIAFEKLRKIESTTEKLSRISLMNCRVLDTVVEVEFFF